MSALRATNRTIAMERTMAITATPRSRSRLLVGLALCGAVLMLFAALSVQRAAASQQVTSFGASVSTSQAGGHPDFTYEFALANPGEPEAAKEVILNAPEGLFGNPNAVPRCTSSDFALQQCPTASQVGLITIRANYSGNPNNLLGTAPIYYVQPQEAEETVRFAFIVPALQIPISTPVAVRTGSDYGLRFSVTGLTQLIPLAGARLTVWGFPAASTHNSDRFGKGSPGNPAGCPGSEDTSCDTAHSAGTANHPMINNPTVCTGEALPVTLSARTYQDPSTLTEAADQLPPVEGCEKLNFYPILNASLTTNETDAPSGLDLELHAKQFETDALSPSQIKEAIVVLPPSLTINPDAADGQAACPDAAANFNTEAPAECPDRAKIGTMELETPALDGPLNGSIYFGEPKPGNQYRVFLIADGFGIHAKLVGDIRPDPVTGRITAAFEDLPQVPFESFNFHIFASQRALLATPTQCANYPIESVFKPWNSVLADQPSTPTFTLSSGPGGRPCPPQIRPFQPRLVAGTSNPRAGAFSNFHLRLDRDDGDQFLGDLNFRMPPGFTGNLRGISYCPDSAIAASASNSGRSEALAPICPISSQIGTTNVAAGPGTNPFNAVGRMFLSGPFKGAPLSLAAITPALAGPYDYGVVVVRVALHVDPRTAQVSAVSDTVPQIIGGVPIRMRSIQVNIDRSDFTINPTNCRALSVDSQGIGDQGTVTDFSSYFHAVNCRWLRFKPKMSIRQTGGRKATRRATNPGLRFDLRTGKGDANVRSLSVTLPNAFEIDQRHLGNLCSENELAEKQCRGRSPIGKARTNTPLLDQPLSGPVFAVSGSGGLPRLAFVLNGQVTLVPRADAETIKGGRLKTTAGVVPDAPIGHFALTVFGGKRAYLINTRDICKNRPVVRIGYRGQNGKTAHQKVKLKTACSNGKKKRSKQRVHSR
jgi:hypothetical protein